MKRKTGHIIIAIVLCLIGSLSIMEGIAGIGYGGSFSKVGNYLLISGLVIVAIALILARMTRNE